MFNLPRRLILSMGFGIGIIGLGLTPTQLLSNPTPNQPINQPINQPPIISIRADNKWVGFFPPDIIQYASLDYDNPHVKIFKQAKLTEEELVILDRFVNLRKVFQDKQANQKTSKDQLEIISGIKLDAKAENQQTQQNQVDLSQLNVSEISKNSLHISLWQNNEFNELMLGTTQEAQAKWPEHIASFLKLLYNPSSRAKTLDIEGIGFTVPLDKPREIGEQMSWATTLRASSYKFEPIEEKTLKTLPNNIQRMVLYSGYIVPLSTEDLKTMSKLGWDEHPKDVAIREDYPISPMPIIWWGLIDFKGKSYGINAWSSSRKP